MRFRAHAASLAAAALVIAGDATAQANPSTAGGPTATVAPGPEYKAGSLERILLGEGWRDLWVTPVEMPVFDIGSYAGGLRVLSRGGGMQSITLHLAAANGWPEYIFRSVNKFPVKQGMPRAVRGTLVGDILQDQTSALFPASALVMPPLLEAINALHVKPELYLMPRDPRLGIYQDTFANLVGLIELNPQEAPEGKPGFAGSRKVTSAAGFIDDVKASRGHHLDERELLAVRLVDFLVGDTDRTLDNMRFAQYGKEGAHTWRPLPRDRDRALMDARGWLNALVMRRLHPKLIPFDRDYSLTGLTFASHDIDRRLLQRLTRSDVREVAQRVQAALTDRVIDEAVASLPREWRTRTTETARLSGTLKARRDGLADFAQEFYGWLATEVDVHGTDEDERVVVERHPDGRVTVTVSGMKDAEGTPPFSSRVFLPAETNEVRVYLHGGSDVAVVRGAPSSDIEVRVIGGGGNDALQDSAGGGGTRFYDSEGKNTFVTTGGTRISLQDWIPPQQGSGLRQDASWRPDWGKSLGFGPTVDLVHGAGVVFGFGPRFTSYGFRRLPHHWKAEANLLVATTHGRPGVSMSANHRMENSPLAFNLAARATRFEAFRFYGMGNDSERAGRDLSLVEQDNVVVEPSLVWEIGWRSREKLGSGITDEDVVIPGLRPLVGQLQAGPVLLWTQADPAAESPFEAARAEFPGAEGRAGMRVGLRLDRTDAAPVPRRGWTLLADLAGYPPVWDVQRSFSTAGLTGAAYVPLPGTGAHVAVRAGGAMAAGPVQLQHAPAIGGRKTLRGYASRRFTGESSAFGSLELRVPAAAVPFLIRWQTGVFALADAGRVWVGEASPGGWHTGLGGGVWFSALGNAFSVAYAHGEEHRVYLQRGLSF